MNKIKIGVGVIVLFLTGFLRDFVFLNVNAAIFEIDNPVNRSYLASPVRFLLNLTEGQLVYLKWIATPAFILLFLILSVKITGLISQNPLYRKLFILVYSTLSGLSFLIYGIFWQGFELEKGYYISREIAGLLQGPFLPVFIISGIYFLDKYRFLKA